MGDGADARRPRRLAAQHRAPGRRAGRGRRQRSTRSSTPARAASRSTRTTAPIPELIDHVLRFADAHDVTVSLHTDGLHEAAELEDTVAAIAGRTVHAYHVEGSGGGHLPDLLGLVREANILCSSTTPTVPFGVNAAAEDVPMIVLNHGASFAVAEDMALVARAGPPGDDGRRGSAPRARRDRHRQLRLAGDGPDDGDGPADRPARARHARLAGDRGRPRSSRPAGRSATTPSIRPTRVLRYLAKVTIEPAIAHGIAEHVGSLQPGRLADIVLWKPAYFGVKPEFVLKAGYAAWAPLGEGNATVERAEPTRYRPDWGGSGRAAASLSRRSSRRRARRIRTLVARLGGGRSFA